MRYLNWDKPVPSTLTEYMETPAPWGLRFLNFFIQKIMRLNCRQRFMVHYTSIVVGKVDLGRGVVRYLANSNGLYIQGINGVKIGDNTMIAPGVKIISANHVLGEEFAHVKSKEIIIGENNWLGANSVILPGVTLGKNVVVGAGSVVTKSFENDCIIAGNPAKVIRKL